MPRNRFSTVIAAAALAVVASPGIAAAAPDADQAVPQEHSTAGAAAPARRRLADRFPPHRQPRQVPNR
jgi:ABC-type phosphate transport system permease subunit